MAKQTTIFGNTDEPQSKTKTHFYNKFDIISYFIKSLRIGDKEQAITALWILLNEGMSQWYIAKKLVQFASEDAVGAEAFLYAQGVFQLISTVKEEENSLARLTLYLCDAPKQWESEEESKWEVQRIHIRERIKNQYKIGEKPLELPSYTWDCYTAKGKAALKRGEQIDRRISGVIEATGLFCRAAYLLHGRLSPQDTQPEQAYSPHLEKCLEEGLHVDAYLKEHGISATEFLG